MRLAPLALIAAALGCNLPGRAPTKDEFNPAGVSPVPIPRETQAEPDAASEAILAEYARRLSEGYPLYPGDEIKFTVLGSAELSLVARVPPEGSIAYPLIGRVLLAGRTVEQVQKDVADRLGRDYLVDPDVTVLVLEYSRKKIYVLGAVKEPREYEIPSGHVVTLLQAVSLAGGFLEDADKHNVAIRRRKDGSQERLTIPVNAVALTREGLGRDPIVLPDDILFVPSRARVFVLGQVARPGAYVADADHGLTVAQAIAVAGGLTRIANDANVRLLRTTRDGRRVTYIVNVKRILSGNPEEDAPLQPGDILFVPESFF